MSHLATVDWWRRRMIELAVALVVTTGVIQLAGAVSWRQKELTPPSAWMEIREIYVPDFEQNVRPYLIYDRAIRTNFNAYWIVELQKKTPKGLWTTTCSGNGVNEFDPNEVIPNNTVSWTWFIGKNCPVNIGVYRLRASWSMTRAGWPEKRTRAISNEFNVLPAEKGN